MGQIGLVCWPGLAYDRHVTRRRWRLTPIGAVVLIVLAAAVVSLFLGSRGLQSIAAFVILAVIVFFAAAHSPRRSRD